MALVTILQGHVLDKLRELPENSIHCTVCSPPYWGLRSYGTDDQIWDGDPRCEHVWGDEINGKTQTGGIKTGIVGSHQDDRTHFKCSSNFCQLCGAWRGSYGLEPTIELYVAHTVEVFRAVRRVLRQDGVCFLNLGDSYASGGGSGAHGGGYRGGHDKSPKSVTAPPLNQPNRKTIPGLKPKDLCGIPWTVALALRADGWWLRSDIIWAKPNPMPESVTDRPTRSHEYIFLLTKSAKYFWDQEAVREKTGSEMQPEEYAEYLAEYPGRSNDLKDFGGGRGKGFKSACPPNGRNLRSVWNIATAPFPDAHFATFPPTLVERCLKAGTSEKGICPNCGKPWVRVVEKKKSFESGSGKSGNPISGKNGPECQGGGDTGDVRKGPCLSITTLGWQPSCKCGGDPIPATVLDSFMGSGTTCLVAAKLGRNSIGIELKQEYVDMATKRLKADLGFLVEINHGRF